jgi:hypothetical protein
LSVAVDPPDFPDWLPDFDRPPWLALFELGAVFTESCWLSSASAAATSSSIAAIALRASGRLVASAARSVCVRASSWSEMN